MLMLERQMEIYAYLQANKFATVDQLSKIFFVAPTSIRRDLQTLERQDYIRRTHGGAMFLEGPNSEIPVIVREKERSDEKEQIGKLASLQVEENDVIFLDGSTTVLAMLPFLKNKNITVLTNSLKVATFLSSAPHVTLYICGGKLRKNEQSVAGVLALDFMEGFSLQKSFFSCRAMSNDCILWDYSEQEASLRKALIQGSDLSYFLCDKVKIGAKAFQKICFCDAIDYFLTECNPEPAVLEILQENGVGVLVAHC